MFKDFFSFCLKPSLLPEQKQKNFDDIFISLFSLWLFATVVSFGLTGFFFLLQDFFHLPDAFSTYSPLSLEDENLLSNFTFSETLGLLGILLAGVIITPFIEEIFFRGPLRLSQWFLTLIFTCTIGVACFFMTPLSLSAKIGDSMASWSDTAIIVTLICIYFFLPFIFLAVTKRYWLQSTQRFLQKFFSVFVWTLCIAFALAHSINFLERTTLTPFLLISTISHLPIAFVLAYVRILYGLQYSVALHILNNAFFILPITFISLIATL